MLVTYNICKERWLSFKKFRLMNSSNFTEYLTSTEKRGIFLPKLFEEFPENTAHGGCTRCLSTWSHQSAQRKLLNRTKSFSLFTYRISILLHITNPLFQAVRKELSFNRSCYKGSVVQELL